MCCVTSAVLVLRLPVIVVFSWFYRAQHVYTQYGGTHTRLHDRLGTVAPLTMPRTHALSNYSILAGGYTSQFIRQPSAMVTVTT